jgi:YlmC/YmxH family sporulation protein
MVVLFSELKRKEVINIRDCKSLGRVCDLELDPCNGCICKIIVCESCRWFSLFSADKTIEICFKDIKQIGPDIILVDINC